MQRRGGVRARVTAVAAAALLAVLLVVALGLVAAQRAALIESVDELLEARASEVARLWVQAPDSLTRGGDDVVWQAVAADGTVVGASDLLAGIDPLGAPIPDGDRDRRGPTTSTTGPAVDAVGAPVRSVARATDGADTVMVVATLEDVEEAITALRGALIVAVPAATLVLAALVWLLVGRSLAPVEDLRSRVAGISADQLDRRVPVPTSRDEVARLAATLNEMLERLEAGAVAQRRFTSDASHELRSPLTRLRARLETAEPDDDIEALRRTLLGDADELQGLVEDLLLLARLDEDRMPAARRVDLDELVLAEVERTRSRGRARTDVEVDARMVSGAEVQGDRRGLQRVVRNLLDNAVRHASSRVEVRLAEDGEVVELVVADDGPGIAGADVERIFERFTRLDAARSRNGGGSGLGLAIVREVTEQHGGRVDVRPGPRGTFRVVLPVARSP